MWVRERQHRGQTVWVRERQQRGQTVWVRERQQRGQAVWVHERQRSGQTVWVHERQHTVQTMSQVMTAFRERFNKAPPRRATLLDWKKRAFALRSVKDRPRQKCGFLVKGESNFTQELEYNPPRVIIWTCNQVIQIKLW
jgi:hypothetical protein